MKPLIHFAHANGVPSRVYQKLFDLLSDEYDVIYVPLLGPDKRYPIDNHWKSLTQQVIDSIVRQANGRKVIGLGHSLGSVLTFQAALQRPELFEQVLMIDPPMIMGKESFALHIAKLLKLKVLDKMSPAGLSKRRRDHWDSREQTAELLRPKGFYKDFDPDCYQAYIDHALMDDKLRGGVELTISRDDEVHIFRTNPSLWWLPHAQPQVPVQQLIAEQGPFLARHFPQMVEKKFAIPFKVVSGSHMFPLEKPVETVELIKQMLAVHAKHE
ncbi:MULTISPECIES: alpha/beta fold hydrolase [unclassified Acinetobacter]|uniref:alpha/beta fold hydrolase n=1 Tax=unclassified Acinetobacter TaxID=196816 RepID=UPI0015D3FEAF|nr:MULTISPECIES: alpha/beta hydrolase [unclassified Acinetobacter]